MDTSFLPPQHSNLHHRQIQYHEAPFQRTGSLPRLPGVEVAGPDTVFHPDLQPFHQHTYSSGGGQAPPPATTGPDGAVSGFEVAGVEAALPHPHQSLPQLRSHHGELLQSPRKHLPHQRQTPSQSHQERRRRQHPQQQQQETSSALDTPVHGQYSIAPQVTPEDANGPPRPTLLGKKSGSASLTLHAKDIGDPCPGGEHDGSQAHSQANAKLVVDPPNLAGWRRRLFDLQEMVTLDQEEFETYFPHVDNVYSHRSTQRYKRKPFVTQYWDCRMKGRPPGTPKSDDPGKKKRKRQARPRDLCDVKIKITEYFVGAAVDAADLGVGGGDGGGGGPSLFSSSSSSSAAAVREALASGVTTRRLWTIQRVNGNGTNGVGDGKLAVHRHSLEKSDEIKKNSVHRWVAAREKDAKKGQKLPEWKATGNAAATAKKHAKESDLKLYASCFCPYSQRVWIALEAKGIPYQYCETNPFRKPKPTHLLEANPRGLVPAIRQGEWACGESAVILEYLEELDGTVLLHPTDPRLKANCRLWIDFINTKVVPSFHALLHVIVDVDAQSKAIEKLQRDVTALVQAADEEGPYFLGDQMCLVDIHFAPFALRLSRMLQPFRGWAPAVPESRWQRWIDAMEGNAHVRNTLSANSLYVETMDLLAQGAQLQGE